MKKQFSAFLAGLVVASVPYLVLTRADAQGAGPGQRGQGGQGQFQGGPGQQPPGQGQFPGGPGQMPPGQGGVMQGVPPISAITSDNEFIYAGAGNWLYKVSKADLKVERRTALTPMQRGDRAPGAPGGPGGSGETKTK